MIIIRYGDIELSLCEDTFKVDEHTFEPMTVQEILARYTRKGPKQFPDHEELRGSPLTPEQERVIGQEMEKKTPIYNIAPRAGTTTYRVKQYMQSLMRPLNIVGELK